MTCNNPKTLPLGAFTVLLTAALTACGGGSGSETTANSDPVDQYVGNWKGCLKTDVNTWQIVEVTNTKSNANSGTTVLKGFATYKDSGCTSVSGTQNDPAQPVKFTLGGLTQIQGMTTQKVDLENSPLSKWIWYRSGNQLLIGDTDSPAGSDGYPTLLMNEPLIKQ